MQDRPVPALHRDACLPSCTVVICTRNRPTHLDRCLKAVVRLVYSYFEVLVVDNAPRDVGTREVAAQWGVRYIIEPVPGLSRARNRGARACGTEIVAYLDDDELPDPEWLSALACEFKDPKVMAVTGRILPLRIETEAERLCASIDSAHASGGEEPQVVNCQSAAWFERASFGGVGNGGNMAFRRCAFSIWRGFDERLGRGTILSGGEEHYAFFSLIDSGYHVVYTPRAVVRHPYPCTMEELRARHLKAFAASAGYMTFLFFEEPRYQLAIIRYIVEWLLGTRRTWRPQVPGSRPRLVPRWRALLALLSGPWLYARSWLKQRRLAGDLEG